MLLMASGICILIWRIRYKRKAGAGTAPTAPEPFPERAVGTTQNIIPRKLRASQERIENPMTQSLPQLPLTKWSRHHSFPPTPECMFSSLRSIPHRQRVHEAPPNPYIMPNNTQHFMVVMDAIDPDRQPAAQIDDALHQLSFTAASLSGAKNARERDGELRTAILADHPPRYTTH